MSNPAVSSRSISDESIAKEIIALERAALDRWGKGDPDGYLEVNAADVNNIRIVVQVEKRTLDLEMGDGEFGARYRNFLSHYAEIRRRSPELKRFDLRLDDRITGKE